MRCHAGQRLPARAARPAQPERKRSAPSLTTGRAPRGREPGQGFRGALERRRGARPPAAMGMTGASAAAMAGWFRPESAAAPAAAKAAGVAGVAAPRAVDRVLIGSGPDGAQARIRIGAGALAGTEIQLSSGASGQTVEARLLTHAASSRQTLSVVMDEIRSRLRDKGIVLSTRAAGARPPAGARDVGGGRRATRGAAVRRPGGVGPVNARPFDLGTCPRVRARQARATRAALRACALLPERWSVEMPPLGSATMTFAGIRCGTGSNRRRRAGGELRRGRAVGSASSRSFAARLVDTVLGGGGVFSTARAVGPAEAWRSRRRARARVRSHRRQPATRPAAGRASGRDRRVWRRSRSVSRRWSASGWLRLTPPAGELLPRIDGADVWRARAGRIPVTGSVEIAATGVPAGAFAGVAVGDAVVFDGVRAAAFAAGGAWNCRASRRRSCRGRRRRRRRQAVNRRWDSHRCKTEEGNMSASDSNTDATTVLAAASIEVVAELGRITLRGDELLGLGAGRRARDGRRAGQGSPCGSAARSGRTARSSTSTVSSASASRASRTARPRSRAALARPRGRLLRGQVLRCDLGDRRRRPPTSAARSSSAS